MSKHVIAKEKCRVQQGTLYLYAFWDEEMKRWRGIREVMQGDVRWVEEEREECGRAVVTVKKKNEAGRGYKTDNNMKKGEKHQQQQQQQQQ